LDPSPRGQLAVEGIGRTTSLIRDVADILLLGRGFVGIAFSHRKQ
jgi:hypothetical protein